MRILVVGLSGSIHLAKSVAALAGTGFDVHVVSSIEHTWHTDYAECTLHHTSNFVEPPNPNSTVRVVDHRERFGGGTRTERDRSRAIAALIDELRPDIVHSQELQAASYQTLLARERCSSRFPTWLVTNWGSDIYYHARPAGHRRAVRAVLSKADFFWAECWRDVALARAEGFRGEVLPTLPIAGGFDVERGISMRRPGPTSARTAIAVKGYQHNVGRAMNTIEALDRVGDLLRGRELILYASTPGVETALRRIADAHGAIVTSLVGVPDDEILRMHGRARVAIGLSLSDGTSTSFLEALVGGAFPIQSSTACAAEFVIDGESGLLVDPTDISAVARALRRALTDDALVDRATPLNDATARGALDRAAVRAGVVDGYRRMMSVAHRQGQELGVVTEVAT